MKPKPELSLTHHGDRITLVPLCGSAIWVLRVYFPSYTGRPRARPDGLIMLNGFVELAPEELPGVLGILKDEGVRVEERAA